MKHRKFFSIQDRINYFFLNDISLISILGIKFHLINDYLYGKYYISDFTITKDCYALKFKTPWNLIIDYLSYEKLCDLEKSINNINNFAKKIGFKTIYIEGSNNRISSESKFSTFRKNGSSVSFEEFTEDLEKLGLNLYLSGDIIWDVK